MVCPSIIFFMHDCWLWVYRIFITIASMKFLINLHWLWLCEFFVLFNDFFFHAWSLIVSVQILVTMDTWKCSSHAWISSWTFTECEYVNFWNTSFKLVSSCTVNVQSFYSKCHMKMFLNCMNNPMILQGLWWSEFFEHKLQIGLLYHYFYHEWSLVVSVQNLYYNCHLTMFWTWLNFVIMETFWKITTNWFAHYIFFFMNY